MSPFVLFVFAFVSFVYTVSSVNVYAQEARATLGGRVTDLQGAVIPDAAVTVTSVQTGVKEQTQTNSQGIWLVQFLQPGHYEFSVSKPGFKTAERRGIELQTADNKTVDTQLELGSVAISVLVSSEAPLIDTTAATSGTVITQKELGEIPTSTHVVTLFSTLSPGVVAQYQNNNVVHMWSYIGASQFEADGGRNNIFSNNFQLDGMPDTKKDGYISFIPPMDSVEEFRVQTNAYDASIGRQAGSSVSLTTKAGGKAYHGNLYEYNQNNFLNAHYFQDNLKTPPSAKPPIHFNEYGGTFGGPVWIPKVYSGKQKTFFFVSVDYTKNVDPRGGIRSIPTALERTGDFSQSFTTRTVSGQPQRVPITIFNPYTASGTNGTRQSFQCDGNGNPLAPDPVTHIQPAGTPCQKIPSQLLSPIAQNILRYVPLPNTAADLTKGNASDDYISPATRQDTFPVVSIRFDQAWNNSHHTFASVRWHHLHEFIDDHFQTIATGNFHERVDKSFALDHVWIISPSKSLDLRFNVNRYKEPSADKGAGFDPTQLGFPASFAAQLRKPSFPNICGGDTSNCGNGAFAGEFGVGNAGNYGNNTYYTWAGNLTHLHGSHTFHYGAEYWILQEGDGDLGNQGRFNFGNNWTTNAAIGGGGTGVGSGFGSFLLGLPTAGQVPNNATALYSQRFWGLYVQDDWRVTPKLTINLGLRWDVERPVVERFDRLTSQFDLNTLNPISPAAQASYAAILAGPHTCSGVPAFECDAVYGTLASLLPASSFRVPGVQLFAGVNGQPRNYSNTDWHEFGPRIGFAYRIGQNTVIRGGFGRFTQATYLKGGQNGFSRTTTLIATQDNFLTPCATLATPFRPDCGPPGVLQPTGSSLGPLTNLGQGVDSNSLDPNRPYSLEYSLHVQHEWRHWLFELGYSHNKTYGIYQDRVAYNYPFSLWQLLRQPQFDSTGRPLDTQLWNVAFTNPFKGLTCPNGTQCITGSIGSDNTTTLDRLINIDPLLGRVTQHNVPAGENRYDAMLSKVERRFSQGFSLIASFTWSKLFEDTAYYPDGTGNTNPNPQVEHKLGGEDRPLVFSFAPVWELPFGRGRKFGASMPRFLDAFAGGWVLTAQYQLQSGVPVVFGTNSFFTGKDPALHNGQSLDSWFDTTQFQFFPSKTTDVFCTQHPTTGPNPCVPYPSWTGVQNLPGAGYLPPGGAGDSVQNGVYQDFQTFIRTYPSRWSNVRTSRVNEVNIGVHKNFKPTEKVTLQLRLDTFNAFNHPRFGGPETNPGNSGFGKVGKSQQNQPRAIELGAKLSF
jgi:hypothetical protein